MSAFNRTEFKSKVIGMILGDGHLTSLKEKQQSVLQMSHSEVQIDYLKHKAQILEELTSTTCSDRMYSKKTKTWFYTLRTKTHPLYTKLRHRAYYDGRKTVTEHLMRLLSAEGLAYWYLDDGSTCGNVLLHTVRYNEAEQQLMAYWLAKRFDLHFKLNRDRKWFRLRLANKDVDRFASLIQPYVPECMNHKIPCLAQNKEKQKEYMRRHRRRQREQPVEEMV